MEDSLYKACLEKALNLTELLREVYSKSSSSCHQTFTTKSTVNDLVTSTDTELEKLIFTEIKKSFPNHRFVGEESNYGNLVELTAEPTWIIDPLDGTTNFVHGFPSYCTSIAMAHYGQVVIGVVYCPFLEKTYYAQKGGGAFCNGHRLQVSQAKSKDSCLLLTEWGSSILVENVAKKAEVMVKLLTGPNSVHAIRSCGSAALNLCMVASGAADCYYEWGVHCWDYAAGSLILCEAGGVVGSIPGNLDLLSGKVIGASSPELLQEICTDIGPVQCPRDDDG